MEFIPTQLKDMWLIRPKRFGDSRGYFCETFRSDLFEEAVGPVRFVQDNESMSRRGVLRGLHYQRGDASQAKLVRVSVGRVLDVAVDLRRSSPTFGRWQAVELSAENGLQLYVPRGFAHGFLVLSDEAQFHYKVDGPYRPEAEAAVAFDDPQLAIAWPEVEGGYVMSEKDKHAAPFSQAELFE